MDHFLIVGNLSGVPELAAEAYVTVSCARQDLKGDRLMRMLPVLRGGHVLEIVDVPSGYTDITFHSADGNALPAQHFTLRRLGWLERVARMGYRVVAAYGGVSAPDRRVLGLSPLRILLDLPGAFRAVSKLRFGWPLSRYEDWAARLDTLNAKDTNKIRQHIEALEIHPRFRVCVLADGTYSEADLAKTQESLANQLYQEFSVDILDAALHVEDLAQTRDAWLLLLQAGDALLPHALYGFANAILEHPEAVMLYADDDVVDANGKRSAPRFKPDWSIAHLRSTNYVGTAFALDGNALAAIGGVPYGDEVTTPFDLMLRLVERVMDYQVVHIPQVLMHRIPCTPDKARQQFQDARDMTSVRAHLERRGMAADVVWVRPGCWRVKHVLPEVPPLVSVIIPTRDALELLRRCVGSLLDKTSYPHFEILVVDNQSRDAEAMAFLNEIASIRNVRVLRYDAQFNYSAINNFAVRQAKGKVICLLNNDTEVISPDWLEEMVGHLFQTGVGVVGAKLYYPDGRVQHGGDVVGPGGCANHLHSMIGRDDPGYCNRAVVAQELSAVTAACMLTWKDIYQRLGGLDERHLPVAFNDVDYCLRVREAGYKVIWTPHAELYHHESVSRGKDKTFRRRREVWYMQRRWREAMRNDPYYNPNFSYKRPDFVLRVVPEEMGAWIMDES